ncbi:Hypothetical protein AA314_03259 [Archangium gephyra]|uniref:Uncharacterized protein n=1 Tax=Archangium gephyra TaxID=48 RepID=A0AAC8TDA7_9BACT|nr:Hypothetical protein AA314_03259 [Archangium gephyra]
MVGEHQSTHQHPKHDNAHPPLDVFHLAGMGMFSWMANCLQMPRKWPLPTAGLSRYGERGIQGDAA